ncbi:probable G-protein coupled receptor Mth-like 5 [Anoplophora glabripennis]|uniref:probable G-protein coupled receptor Mth-like 5 n=1 Tax=Anoplophora glabripennis TaxID=217634 RepID=UPI000873A123|nr:probable G-protein coupled receptor Mth-like 5 [Anoplophora glabripennis]
MIFVSFSLYVVLTCVYPELVDGEVVRGTVNTKVRVNKCCEENEIYLGKSCTRINKTSEQWKPSFTSENGNTNLQIEYMLVTGSPDCGHVQTWEIHQTQNSTDHLLLLPNGVLRHFIKHFEVPEEEYYITGYEDDEKMLYQDYEPGKYCLDKSDDNLKGKYAKVCSPDILKDLFTTEFLMHNVVNPITHGITIVCLLVIAIIYFVMPTLRDLTGNIITTICMCLILSQTADMIRLLTVFRSHTSLLITETICYVSMLGAFFWLNSLGYYIWKTFRSRNVFLRITDGKKYCYYCAYSWSCTLILGTLAILAHFTMDYSDIKYKPISPYEEQEEVGSLGMIIFFVPVAFTIIVDIFFFATTLQTINRMHTYGRIHHKLRHSFRMFLLLLLVMALCWLFFLSSFSKLEGLINGHIIVNALLGPLVLYVCIFNQKHVSYLIRKTCCYTNCPCSCCRPEPECEWGDEMTAMNTECNY